MALVLSGDGTVTGLAVGGLPDGTVDAGTLATDSVTAAKLEASAITGADLPTGSVLQVIESTSLDTTTIASISFQDLDLNVAITPSSTSSKILVMVDFAYTQDGGENHRGHIQILRDTTAIGNHLVGYDSPGGDVGFGCHIQKLDAPSSTSEITYKAQARTENTSSQFRPQASGSIVVMEIAG